MKKMIVTLALSVFATAAFAIGGQVNTGSGGDYCSYVVGDTLNHAWCDAPGVTCGAVGGECTVNGVKGTVKTGPRKLEKKRSSR